MKSLTLSLCLSALVSTSAFAANPRGDFPIGPDPSVTPGSLCIHPDDYRYPEKIGHCDRDVSTQEKRRIIRYYDNELGYRIGEMRRQDFKIDHVIPLCIGGGNEPTNLWPQHKSVYEITDPMEQMICEKVIDGSLKQAEAISLIQAGKRDLSKVPEILDQVSGL